MTLLLCVVWFALPSETNDGFRRDVVRSRLGRLGEDSFHQLAGIFSVNTSEGAAVPFLPPSGLENVHNAFQDEMPFCMVVPAIGAE